MTRRELLWSVAALAPLSLKGQRLPKAQPPSQAFRTTMGIATTSYMTVRRFRDTYEFLEHCHQLGAAGIQSALNGDMAKIRAKAEEFGMFVEVILPLPRGEDTSVFEHTVKDAVGVGALCVRANAGGRRYEDFSTRADYQAFAERSKAAIKAAVPICEKYKMPLALENHKDWTLDQIVEILKSYSSEYFGTCLDFGNNIALCEDPMDVARKLAPYAVTTHVKDMGVEPYPEGFLLSEVPLGTGFLDVPAMIAMVRKARPKTNFNLEMITRDPLKIPCLTDKYWATFPERRARYLGPALALVKKHASTRPLQRISQLPHDEQLRAEEENVALCLSYAREKLARNAS